MGRRGTTLGTVLLVLTCSLTLVLTSASVGIFNLRFTTALDNRDHARNLAESAIDQAVAALADSTNFGVNRRDTDTVTITSDGLQGAYGLATFNQTVAQSYHWRYSTNNLANTAQASGDGRSVPPGAAQIMGLGVCGDAVERLEMVIYRPPYPRSMAGTGAINVTAVTVAGIKPGATYSGLANMRPGDQQPGSLFACSPAGNAVTIGSACNIVGDAGSVGGIKIAPGSTVSGEVRQHSPAEQIPSLDVAGSVASISGQAGLGTFTPGIPLKDFACLTGPTTVGDVALDGGALAVRGDLHVTGTVHGFGAVVVDGKISVDHGSTLLSGDSAALMATGDINLKGTGSGSFIQGMIYSQGNIWAHDLTLVGSVVANGGNNPGRGTVNLQDVTLIQCSGAVTGGLLPAQYYTLGSPADDGAMLQVGCKLDPSNPGQYLLFGSGIYSINPPSGNPPSLSPVTAQATWPPSTRDIFEQSLYQFMDTDISSGNSPSGVHYYPYSVQASLAPLLDALSGGPANNAILSFNVNNVLPQAQLSRVLLFREVND